jgi:hypothetical protein
MFGVLDFLPHRIPDGILSILQDAQNFSLQKIKDVTNFVLFFQTNSKGKHKNVVSSFFLFRN